MDVPYATGTATTLTAGTLPNDAELATVNTIWFNNSSGTSWTKVSLLAAGYSDWAIAYLY